MRPPPPPGRPRLLRASLAFSVRLMLHSVWQDESLPPAAFSGQLTSRSVKRLSAQRARGTTTARAFLSAVEPQAAPLPPAPLEMIQALEQVRLIVSHARL